MAVASKLARAARTAASAADKKPARVRKKVSEKKPDRAQRESDRADELRKTKSDYSQRVRDRVGEVEAAAGRINARTGGADRFARRLETEALNVYNKPSITEGSRSFVRMQEAASEGSRKRAKRVVDLERVGLAKLLLHVGHDLHIRLLVHLEACGDPWLFRFLSARTVLIDEAADILQVGVGVVQLDARLGTEFLIGGRTDIEVIDQGLVLQLLHLGCFRQRDLHFQVRFPHHGGHHEEEQEHENDVRQ